MHMSKQINVGKKNIKKAALGRGLGSLLGGSLDDSPVEEIELPDAEEKAVETKEKTPATTVVAEKNVVPQLRPKIKEGFVEEEKKVVVKEVIKEVIKEASIPETARIWNVAIDKLMGNKEQPRKYFDKEALGELANSIKEQGILQPIVVRKKDDGNFEIIAGERRWRASQIAGLHEVPVILKETDNQKALELALIENIQREDLNVIEEAKAYSHLMKEYGLTQQQLSEKVGKERATIANVLRLLNLTPEVQNMVALGDLSLGQAKVIMGLIDPLQQKKVAKKVVKNKLTVKATEKLIQQIKTGSAVQSADALNVDVSSKLISSLSEELQKILGTKVSIDYLKGKGKVSVHFYSDDELNQFVDTVRSAWQK